jgi:hypothetical protein
MVPQRPRCPLGLANRCLQGKHHGDYGPTMALDMVYRHFEQGQCVSRV